jgi:hypothetical protein
MRVDDESKRPLGSEIASHLPRAFRSRRLVLVVYTLLIFGIGVAVQRAGLIGAVLEPVRDLRTLPTRLKAMQVEAERITIDIKHKHYLQLAHKREEALARRLLVSSPDDMVPATIRTGERSVSVKLRLKGDLRDHWQGDKWSFRIRVRGEDTLWGMKQLSIQQPATRNFLYEWLYHENLRREGLPALRYRFVDVVVNGEHKGIYAVEEHFEKRLVENAGQREGPILRFDEDPSWIETRDQGFLGFERPNALSGSGSYLASDVDGFGTNRWVADPAKREQYLEAAHLLEGFRRGKLPAAEVFDVPAFVTFLAVSDLHEAGHATSWRNLRFYYNPVTSRLVPIGFDGTDARPAQRRTITAMRPWYVRQSDFYDLPLYRDLFADADVFRAYVAELERVSAPEYLDELIGGLQEDIDRHVAVLQRDYPEFKFSRKPLDETSRFIRGVLNPPKGPLAHLVTVDGDTVELEVGNTQLLPVEVLEVGVEGGARTRLPEGLRLPGRPIDALVDYQRVTVKLDGGVPEPPSLTVHYRIAGTRPLRGEPVVPWPSFPEDFQANLTRREPNAASFEFVEVDDTAGEIRVRPGNWRIDRDLIVPAGYVLRAGAGTVLELSGPAVIVSRSPLAFTGEPERPVLLHGDGSLFVLEAGARSRLEHVVFDGLSEPSSRGMNLTGAVTFYQSPVDFLHCTFLGARAEDSLNVIRSPFLIQHARFDGAASDAFDADFSDGTIEDTVFENPVNDGIDVSGSIVNVRRVTVRRSGDKAISAGENSRLTAQSLRVEDSKVGVASKDLSHVLAYGVSIASTEIGLAAYQKKAEFGPAGIEVVRLELSGVGEPLWIEERSQARIDGEDRPGDRTNPRPVFYPDE